MKKVIITVLVTIVSLVAIFLAYVFFGSFGVTDAADKILADFEKNQFEKVYKESLLDDEFTLEQLQEAFGVGTPYDITKAKKKSWNGRGFDGGIKYVWGTFIFPNGEELPLTFTFIEQNDNLVLIGIVNESR